MFDTLRCIKGYPELQFLKSGEELLDHGEKREKSFLHFLLDKTRVFLLFLFFDYTTERSVWGREMLWFGGIKQLTTQKPLINIRKSSS